MTPPDLEVLFARVAAAAPGFPLGTCRRLTIHGEPLVALEILCDNLDEYAVPLDASTRRLLAAGCRYYRVDARYWRTLTGE